MRTVICVYIFSTSSVELIFKTSFILEWKENENICSYNLILILIIPNEKKSLPKTFLKPWLIEGFGFKHLCVGNWYFSQSGCWTIYGIVWFKEESFSMYFGGTRIWTRKHACIFGGHTLKPHTRTRTHTAAFILMIIHSYECM